MNSSEIRHEMWLNMPVDSVRILRHALEVQMVLIFGGLSREMWKEAAVSPPLHFTHPCRHLQDERKEERERAYVFTRMGRARPLEFEVPRFPTRDTVEKATSNLLMSIGGEQHIYASNVGRVLLQRYFKQAMFHFKKEKRKIHILSFTNLIKITHSLTHFFYCSHI